MGFNSEFKGLTVICILPTYKKRANKLYICTYILGTLA